MSKKIKSAVVTVDYVEYKVIENLPFHAAGMRSKYVETKSGEKIVVFDRGEWRFWTVRDRLGH